MSIPIEELFLITYVLVDDWYQSKGKQILNRTVGRKPEFTDSEVLTLMLAIDFFEFSSERRYLAFVRANYLDMFPNLPVQSQFNRRSRSLRLLLNELRKEWLWELGGHFEQHFLLDTTPIPVVGYNRSKSRSSFRGTADYGYCSARNLHYYGYKLVMLTSLNGTPYSFELVPANTDERVAANEILYTLPYGSNVWGDKGFIGQEWQDGYSSSNIHIWTTKRKNQTHQNPPEFDRLLNRVRERIEGTFDLLKEGGRSIEQSLAKTVDGLASRIISKITSLTFRLFMKNSCNIDLMTYSLYS